MLAQACEALQDAVYIKDLDGLYLMANAAATAGVGLEPDGLVGRIDREVFPEDWEAIRRADREVVASGVSQTIEEPVVIDGELRTYMTTKAPLRDHSGEIIGVIGISTDISARKAAEEELREREAKLAEAQAVARVGSWEWDLVRNEATWSTEVYRALGVRPDEFEPTYDSFLATVHPEDRERVAAALQRSLETGEEYKSEFRIVRPDGNVRTILARANVFTDLDGKPLRMVGAGLDVTDQRLSDLELQAREAMLNLAQELTRVGSFQWEIAPDRVTWSDGLYRIFGLEPGEIPGTFEGYLEHVPPQEREERRRTIERVVETGHGADGEHRIVRADGEVRWIESRIRRLADENGHPTRLVGICQDVTERKLATAELESEVEAAQERALHDPLTGLPNRTLAFDRLEHAFVLAERRGSDLAVLFVDIDGFKRVNDRFGHAAGDRLLTSVAQRLHGSVRGSDTVARLGGDEFLVICEEAAAESEVVEAADRIHAAFASPFELSGSEELVSLSIGASAIRDRSLSAVGQLIDEADAAMYEAKRRGSGGFALSRAAA